MKISARTKAVACAVACAVALALAPMGAAAQEKGEKPVDRDTSRIESVDELASDFASIVSVSVGSLGGARLRFVSFVSIVGSELG